VSGSTIENATDANVGAGIGIQTYDTTNAAINNNHIETNAGGGIQDYASSGTSGTGNTITGNAAFGIENVGSTNETVDPNTISNNAGGGVILQGAVTGTVVGPNTISDNAAGGVLLQAAFGATVTGNTLTSDAAGGVVAEDPPPVSSATPTDPCAPQSPSSDPCQNSGNTVSNNTVSGTSGAGVQLELTGGDSITGNTISGLGEGGEGIILVGSDNDTVSTNTVSGSAAGVVVTGNDLTGPSTNSTVDNNNFSTNILGGAAVDGYGSPLSWNRVGTELQGIQGVVFFQSDTAIGAGTPTSGTGAPQEVVTPSSFGAPAGAADYSGVAEYLAGAGAICGTSAIPVDGQQGDGGLYACTDGLGDIFLEGVVTNAITAGSGSATGSSTTSEPGCEASPASNTGAVPCSGTVLTLSDLPYINEVAEGNSFNQNQWNNETIAGAIDGSGPNAQYQSSDAPYADGNPSNPSGLENTWTNNTGSPGASAANPTTADPAAGT